MQPRQILKEFGIREKTAALPSRINQAIRQQDNSSEVLVKVIQLGVVAVLGILYLISPKTDAGTAFSPVPLALACYLILNTAGLVWAAWRGLPNWAVYVSIVIDMALLMVLIWSFHIQYAQPPSFYLKAPTLLYIFIFIALRTLRFQARFVIAAGLVAAAGWLAMILYVTLSDPENSMITRDYVQYLTSNSILLGAEFDKIISILVVTGILALALHRAHRLLVRAVTQQAAAQDLSHFFDESVASLIKGSEEQISAGQGVKRTGAVLNADIRGFTRLAAGMDANEVMGMLADYQKRLVPIIQANGGTIDKFLGDGIMATFGVVSPTETFAADSLRAMDQVIAESKQWQTAKSSSGLKSLVVNAAVASGSIAFGAVGDEKRLEYTVIGGPVNLSAKLEKHNKELGSCAVTTRETYDLAVAQGYAPGRKPETVTCTLHGVKDEQTLVILSD
ncbi:MAG: adenylate/guanylate cyclase domain-containing protein [Methyloligellaceae bacterium]